MQLFEDFAQQSTHVMQLKSDFASHAFVHAYLLCGPRGTGKKSVARLCAMAAVCRCEDAASRPCGACGPCRRVLSDTHPDLHTIVPEKGKKSIGIDVMRDTIAQVGVKSFEAGTKAMLIPQAELMTPQAQNCLLKTLEEPPENTVFFLITEQPGSLLPTIVSRCRVIRFHPLSAEECEKRLIALGQPAQAARQKAKIAEGCVGQALEIDDERLALMHSITQAVFSVHKAGDVLAVVNQYKDDKEQHKQMMDLLECAVRDITLAQAGAGALKESGYAPQAEAYARCVPLTGGLALAQTITKARMMMGSNVAFASVFEMILLKIAEEYTKWPW